MGLVGTIGMVSFGALIGHVGPRLPTLLLTRGRGFNVHFSEHPEPVALSPHLTQRILHLRAFYWLSFCAGSRGPCVWRREPSLGVCNLWLRSLVVIVLAHPVPLATGLGGTPCTVDVRNGGDAAEHHGPRSHRGCLLSSSRSRMGVAGHCLQRLWGCPFSRTPSRSWSSTQRWAHTRDASLAHHRWLPVCGTSALPRQRGRIASERVRSGQPLRKAPHGSWLWRAAPPLGH